LELFGALEVFREGAENRTRGACAPFLNFGFRDYRSTSYERDFPPVQAKPIPPSEGIGPRRGNLGAGVNA
jgi:hypothetical protein